MTAAVVQSAPAAILAKNSSGDMSAWSGVFKSVLPSMVNESGRTVNSSSSTSCWLRSQQLSVIMI